MSENFLIYANTPLRGKPENLFAIFNEIKIAPSIQYHPYFYEYPTDPFTLWPLIESILQKIIRFTKCSKFAISEAESIFREYQRRGNLDSLLPGEIEIAFEAVYGFADGYCMVLMDDGDENDLFDDRCGNYFPGRHSMVDEGLNLFEVSDDNPGRLKCFECEQRYFIKMLDSIIIGKKYCDIPGCQQYFGAQYLPFIIDPMFNYRKGMVEGSPYKHVFNEFVRGIISCSLMDFLKNNNNRKKLKRCPICEKFFIAKDAKRIVCYQDQCEKKYCNDYQKEYMKTKRDPESPKFNLNYVEKHKR